MIDWRPCTQERLCCQRMWSPNSMSCWPWQRSIHRLRL